MHIGQEQIAVAHSSTEEEYRALVATTAERICLHRLLQNFGVDCSTATKLHYDNRSSVQIYHNDVFHERYKYIEIDFYFIHHHLLQGTLTIQFVHLRIS